ncbi:hypothetical protein AB0H86_13380 [Streptomyces sp. NPDC050997]|uniref:hypothetical protein n=1 Tax=Streptomyces sp. NPDC050997 TaxID=3155519 RepID=UPI00342DF1E7
MTPPIEPSADDGPASSTQSTPLTFAEMLAHVAHRRAEFTELRSEVGRSVRLGLIADPPTQAGSV